MRIIDVLTFGRARRRVAVDTVANDAAALMDLWGDLAHDVAADLSWREDAGLLHTSTPGHWARVQQEIGFRLGLNGDWDHQALAAA